MLDTVKYVSRGELMAETGVCNTTIAKYLHDYGLGNEAIPRERKEEVCGYIRNRVAQARENSDAAKRKGKVEYDRKQKALHNWRVSIRGNQGWLVVRTGTRDKMEAWAELLLRNGIEARACENEHGKTA